ncbi:type 1 glutamine amidotransferase domain-containing protein [Mucilaginibacter inviolabilis]|uniref:type 1 glutamine amidotransferase domain-containing protein n=1 Tax=Mucilaginibacter inviolabilis TaxID=2714892 RepID=UPI001F42A2C9|nr:type 1 glutamine amidotransferase domain-containing protein [Mucilaginibacter inviolabilis]
MRTGLWLSELTHFYQKAQSAGYDITVASPKGGATPIDPVSLRPLHLDRLSKASLSIDGFKAVLQQTHTLQEVSNRVFDCILLTGGHGTMYDFPNDRILQHIIKIHYERGNYIAAICHGVSGLLNVLLSDGEHLIRGKQITVYDWFEELLARRRKQVPFNLEKELKRRGANYKKALIPMTKNVCEDGNLITGQNPFSSKAIASKLLVLLSRRQR